MVTYTNIHRAAGPSGLAAFACEGGDGLKCDKCVWADVTMRDETGNVTQVLCIRPDCKGGRHADNAQDDNTRPVRQGTRND